jgi:hypothetical protein
MVKYLSDKKSEVRVRGRQKYFDQTFSFVFTAAAVWARLEIIKFRKDLWSPKKFYKLSQI